MESVKSLWRACRVSIISKKAENRLPYLCISQKSSTFAPTFGLGGRKYGDMEVGDYSG